MPSISEVKEISRRIGRTTTFKLITICVLILVLLIPLSMVRSLISEREYRQQEVIDDINQKWGQDQTMIGPVISIPYIEDIKDMDKKITTITKYMHFLPDTVIINSKIVPEIRYRGIYEAVLYNTTISIDGSFPDLPVDELRVPPENIIWDGAFIAIGITDMRGIKESITARFDDADISMEPGVETNEVIPSGSSAAIRLDSKRASHPFHFDLNLNGSRQIHFSPSGKVTTVTAASNWKDPSFGGAFLPVEHTVTDSGFTAKWKVLHLNLNYPQHWKGSGPDMYQSTFGVDLFSPVDIYQKSTRTAKYGLMFIVFTFTAFFLSEVINRQQIHPVQYLLIGFAMIVFYTLLLSISEQILFGAAYLISAGAVIALITGYTKAILKNSRVTMMVSGILIALYSYLYLLLQLEDYALLMGSVGLFVVLSFVMFLTRKIDWYSRSHENKPNIA